MQIRIAEAEIQQDNRPTHSKTSEQEERTETTQIDLGRAMEVEAIEA